MKVDADTGEEVTFDDIKGYKVDTDTYVEDDINGRHSPIAL
jgi:non-homologous end joining protein Ku